MAENKAEYLECFVALTIPKEDWYSELPEPVGRMWLTHPDDIHLKIGSYGNVSSRVAMEAFKTGSEKWPIGPVEVEFGDLQAAPKRENFSQIVLKVKQRSQKKLRSAFDIVWPELCNNGVEGNKSKKPGHITVARPDANLRKSELMLIYDEWFKKVQKRIASKNVKVTVRSMALYQKRSEEERTRERGPRPMQFKKLGEALLGFASAPNCNVLNQGARVVGTLSASDTQEKERTTTNSSPDANGGAVENFFLSAAVSDDEKETVNAFDEYFLQKPPFSTSVDSVQTVNNEVTTPTVAKRKRNEDESDSTGGSNVNALDEYFLQKPPFSASVDSVQTVNNELPTPTGAKRKRNEVESDSSGGSDRFNAFFLGDQAAPAVAKSTEKNGVKKKAKVVLAEESDSESNGGDMLSFFLGGGGSVKDRAKAPAKKGKSSLSLTSEPDVTALKLSSSTVPSVNTPEKSEGSSLPSASVVARREWRITAPQIEKFVSTKNAFQYAQEYAKNDSILLDLSIDYSAGHLRGSIQGSELTPYEIELHFKDQYEGDEIPFEYTHCTCKAFERSEKYVRERNPSGTPSCKHCGAIALKFLAEPEKFAAKAAEALMQAPMTAGMHGRSSAAKNIFDEKVRVIKTLKTTKMKVDPEVQPLPTQASKPGERRLPAFYDEEEEQEEEPVKKKAKKAKKETKPKEKPKEKPKVVKKTATSSATTKTPKATKTKKGKRKLPEVPVEEEIEQRSSSIIDLSNFSDSSEEKYRLKTPKKTVPNLLDGLV